MNEVAQCLKCLQGKPYNASGIQSRDRFNDERNAGADLTRMTKKHIHGVAEHKVAQRNACGHALQSVHLAC